MLFLKSKPVRMMGMGLEFWFLFGRVKIVFFSTYSKNSEYCTCTFTSFCKTVNTRYVLPTLNYLLVLQPSSKFENILVNITDVSWVQF